MTDVNPGRGEVVVLFTGYMFGAWTFRDVVDGLKDYRVLVFEDIGAAGPSCAGGSFEAAIGAVAAALDRERVRSVHLMGHSMGGFVAQEFCSACPDRVKTLALLGSCHIEQFKQSHRVNALPALDPLFNLGADSFFTFATNNIFGDAFLKDPRHARELRRDFDANVPDRERCRDQLHMLSRLYESSSADGKIGVPCVAVFGRRDKIVPEDWVRRLSDHCSEPPEFRPIDSSHMFMYEEPEATSGVLIDWIERHG